jgi:hypothetical protein
LEDHPTFVAAFVGFLVMGDWPAAGGAFALAVDFLIFLLRDDALDVVGWASAPGGRTRAALNPPEGFHVWRLGSILENLD